MNCALCGKEAAEDSLCPLCKKGFCSEHIFPDNHSCGKIKKPLPKHIPLAMALLLIVLIILGLVYITPWEKFSNAQNESAIAIKQENETNLVISNSTNETGKITG